MSESPLPLNRREQYSCEQCRELDRIAIEEHGIAGITLMKRAGRAAFAYAMDLWPNARHWVVLCGAGNNGGDGYVFAALARQKGHEARVLWVSDPARLKGDALRAYQYAEQEGVTIEPFADADLGADVIVDALLGTGINGTVREDYRLAIEAANESRLPILALDIPSGLCGNTGAELGCAIQASATITFIGCKLGLMTGRGPACTGALCFDGLGVPDEIYHELDPLALQPDRVQLAEALPIRAADAHKGQFGFVMVVGGDLGYGGAAIMAAEAAAYSGAGLIGLATQAAHVSAALVRRPELMVVGVPSGQELNPYLQRPDVIVIGPGLGQSPWSEQMLQQSFVSEKPLVLDADALNIIAEGRLPLPDHQRWVMTPHPGEAARLLNIHTEQVQQNRIAAIKALQKNYGGVVVLKGAGTLIYDGEQMMVARVGNPGLARGGSGDVLSGVIGSLLAQGLSLFEAAQLAVCLHGDAADLAVEESSKAGLLASELSPYIRELMVRWS